MADELDDEMRREADNQARVELERLKSAYDRDRGRKSKGKRKTARKAAKKAKRGRKEKDLTPDRTLESLVEELVQVGIVRSYPAVDIGDFWGPVAVVDPLSRKWKRDTFPGLGDIRSTIIENCILTLGTCPVSALPSQRPIVNSNRLRRDPKTDTADQIDPFGRAPRGWKKFPGARHQLSHRGHPVRHQQLGADGPLSGQDRHDDAHPLDYQGESHR